MNDDALKVASSVNHPIRSPPVSVKLPRAVIEFPHASGKPTFIAVIDDEIVHLFFVIEILCSF